MKRRPPARAPAATRTPRGHTRATAATRPDASRRLKLARLLTGTDRLAALLAPLHVHAIQAAGGSSSILLQFEPHGARLHATSAHGVERLPADSWPQTDAEARVVERVLQHRRPSPLPADRLPGLSATLRTDVVLLVPLVRLGEPVGMLAIGRPRGAIAAATIDEVEGAGHAFVIALGQTRAARDTELQRDLRALLAEFSRDVSSSFSLTGGLETFCAGANRLFGAGRTSVWMHDRRAHEMVLDASSDTAYLARGGRVSTGDPALPAAVALRRDRAEIPVRLPGGTSDGATGVVTVPLRGRRRALGTLVFEGVRVDRSDEMDLLARADEVGRQLAAAIDNVRLLDGMLRAHRQLENTFNSIMDLVVVSDRRGRVVHVNRALAERLGRTHGELVDRPLEEVMGPDMARLAAGLGIEDRDDADRSVTGVTCEIEDPVLNGVFSVTVTRLHGESRESLGLVVIARDVTPHARLEAERIDLQNRLAQSEKLAALGQLVAGIAHELNNPLQGVLGHLELLRATGAFPKALRRDVQRIYREADRAAKIVRNLLVFAGSRQATRRRLRLAGVLSRALALRVQACRANEIEVIRQFGEGLPAVLGDPLLLQQAFLNVLINAEQAIGERPGGRITVAAVLAPARDRIVTTVRDTGPGIATQAIPRIFEPFYTTKDVGRGIGLGLAITYGIIQEHGGEIAAGNHPDGGAVFTIALPVEGPQNPLDPEPRHD